MDVNLYLRVLWRFRFLVLLGMVAATTLALLSLVRIDLSDPGRLEYRQEEQWVSYSTLFVTQQGFPWGRTIVIEGARASVDEEVNRLGIKLADPGRFSTLAILYSRLADSDPVRAIMLKDGPIEGTIEAAPILASEGGGDDALPLISIAAIAPTPAKALNLVKRETAALRQYLALQQRTTRIPEAERVVVSVLKRGTEPELFAGRSTTPAIVTFLAVMIAVLGLAFLLENLRPRRRLPAGEDAQPASLDVARRTA